MNKRRWLDLWRIGVVWVIFTIVLNNDVVMKAGSIITIVWFSWLLCEVQYIRWGRPK